MISFTVRIQYILKGTLTVGELTPFIGYINYALSDFISGMEEFLKRMPYLKQSLDRFHYFLSLDEYKKNGKSLEKVNTIEINHL